MESTVREIETKIDTMKQIGLYVERLQALLNKHHEVQQFPESMRSTVTVEFGKKNARIITGYGQRLVHTFVDMTNGNILKAASWKAPAPNGVRGNIFNDNSDVGTKIGVYGAEYLR